MILNRIALSFRTRSWIRGWFRVFVSVRMCVCVCACVHVCMIEHVCNGMSIWFNVLHINSGNGMKFGICISCALASLVAAVAGWLARLARLVCYWERYTMHDVFIRNTQNVCGIRCVGFASQQTCTQTHPKRPSTTNAAERGTYNK